MKFLHLIILTIISTFSSPSCVRSKKTQGSLIKKRYSYDNVEKKFIIEPQIPSSLFWYLDNYIIQEVRGFSSKSLNGEIISIDTSVTHYTFYDLAKNQVYYYDRFTTNAKLLKTFYLPQDSLIDGWNFQRNDPYLGRENLTTLPDTVIQGRQLRRLQTQKFFHSDTGTIEHLKIGYIRSDITASLFHLDKPLDDSLQTTMVRLDFWVKPANIAMSSSFEFLRYELTDHELAVFKAWIKRAKSAK